MSLGGRYKTWFIAVFLVPLAIYVFYFYLGLKEARQEGQTEQAPQTYLEAGTPVNINGETYRAGAEGFPVAFYNNLKAGNNNIMPDPGYIFALIPVLVPVSQDSNQPARTWSMLDNSGRRYSPLATDTERFSNLQRLEEKDILPGTQPEYLIFKVIEGAETFYLKLTADQIAHYWRIDA